MSGDGGGGQGRDVRLRLGREAESLAAALLESKGLTIVARNWRRPEGEIDLVADHAGACVFIEVRSRTGDELGHPLETIGGKKRARVIRAARLYLNAVEVRAPAGFRFDVVGVTFHDDGRPPTVEHVENAFDVT